MHQPDRDEILALYRELLLAWNRRDADAFGDCFTENGSAIGFDGSPMNGRAEIVASLKAVFDGHSTAAYVSVVREVRVLGPGVILIRAVVGMVPPGQARVDPRVNALQSVIAVDTGDEMKIALLQNTPAAFHGRPEMVQQLTEELIAAAETARPVS